ncbi:MAG: hypothetical protein WC554_13575 [Clostridia bacterium]
MKTNEVIRFDVLNPPYKDPLKRLIEEMDKCVFCGTETSYPKNMNIDCRYNYIEGAGQLCQKCADLINKKYEK